MFVLVRYQRDGLADRFLRVAITALQIAIGAPWALATDQLLFAIAFARLHPRC